jgi:hypothetical protein
VWGIGTLRPTFLTAFTWHAAITFGLSRLARKTNVVNDGAMKALRRRDYHATNAY